jgi:hypothetical protein
LWRRGHEEAVDEKIIYFKTQTVFTFMKEVTLLELCKILSHNIATEISVFSTQRKITDDAV